jgi:hypothetical protein
MQEYTCKLRTHDDNSLNAQDPRQIKIAVDYYAQKIISEDRELNMLARRKGLSRIYFYYAQALIAVPQWRGTGIQLLWIAFCYWPFGMLRRLPRYVWFRSLNNAYQQYSKLRLRIKKFFNID